MLNINNVLANLNTNYSQVTDLVPDLFYFGDDVELFRSNGNTRIYNSAVQSDGKILAVGEGVAGWGNNYEPSRLGGAIRFNVDGTVDDTYARLGFDQVSVFAVDVQSDDKAIVAGSFSGIGFGGEGSYYANCIIRLNTTGMPDDTFNIGTGFGSNVEDIIVLSNDSILACGYFGTFNDVATACLTKLNSDGTLDTVFNDNFSSNFFNSIFYEMAVYDDGRIVFGGNNGFISRINSDGLYDGIFASPEINGDIYTVSIQSDDKILIGGAFTNVNGNPVTNICRLNSDGTFDDSFAPSGNGFQYYGGGGYAGANIISTRVQSDGKILVGGYFNSYNSELRNYICRLNSDGTIDNSFISPYSFDDPVLDINYVSTNNILVGGRFRHPRIAFVKLTNAGNFGSFGVDLPNDTWGIDDGGNDMYDGANFINTDKTQLYEDILSSVDERLSVPSTHIQNDNKDLYDVSSPYLYKYVPSTLTAVVKNSSFYKKPSWMDTFEHPQVGYGFDQNGMWFVNNAEDGTVYPVRSNFDISDTETSIIIFTFIHDENCSDQGICVYNALNNPEWSWSPNATRIALSYNCPEIIIYGQIGEVADVVEIIEGQTYTAKVTYNPIAGTFTAETYSGTSAIGEPISTISLEETLPAGNYRVAFCSDQDDNLNSKSYFTYVSIEAAATTYVMEKEDYFGSISSQYFTQMYPGMFVMAATGININEFSITGNIGSDGAPPVTDIVEIYPIVSNGNNYTVFYKSNYNADEDPSINHFIIVPGDSTGITHLYDDGGERDNDCLQGLSGKDEIYFLVIGRGDRDRFTDGEATAIAQKFLDIITADIAVVLCTPTTCGIYELACQLTTSCECAKARLFAPGCTLKQANNRTCSANNAAYVPAITVCRQRLF